MNDQDRAQRRENLRSELALAIADALLRGDQHAAAEAVLQHLSTRGLAIISTDPDAATVRREATILFGGLAADKAEAREIIARELFQKIVTAENILGWMRVA